MGQSISRHFRKHSNTVSPPHTATEHPYWALPDARESDGERMMLVYEHKANSRKLVPNGVSIMSDLDIVMAMSAHPDLYMVTKVIQAGQTHINLYKVDLLREDEKQDNMLRAKVEDKLETPWRVFLGYEWDSHSFQELTSYTTPKEGSGDRSDGGTPDEQDSSIASSVSDSAPVPH